MLDQEEAARLDRLRRRLYDRDASDEDRRRYEALRGRLAEAEGAVAEPAAAAARGPRRAALLVMAGVGAAAVLVALLLPRPEAVVPAARPTAAPLPTPVEVSVQGVATTGQRFHGVGGEGVQLVTGSAPPFGGRLVVVLTAADGARLGWRAVRPAVRTNHERYEQVLAASGPAVRGRLGRPESRPYDGDPPAGVVVTAPAGTAWTLTVLLLDPEPTQAG